MGEPDRNKVTEAETRRAGSTVTIATMKRDEAPALVASLPFLFFRLSCSGLALHRTLF